jgi:hypothetical protein
MAGGRARSAAAGHALNPATALTRTIRRLRDSRSSAIGRCHRGGQDAVGFFYFEGLPHGGGMPGGEVRRAFSVIVSYTHSYAHGELLNEPSRVVNLLRLSTADSLTRACRAQGALHAHRQGARDARAGKRCAWHSKPARPADCPDQE